MKTWLTTIIAKCPLSGVMKTYSGPNVQAPSRQLAFDWCQNNGLGYCQIAGELISEIPCKDGSYEPDWDNAIDFRKPQEN